MRRMRFPRSLGSAGAVLAAAVLAGPLAGQADERDRTSELRTWGQAEFDWRIRPLEGEPMTLAEFRGKTLFINLWATWCTPCVRELASIERLRDRLDDTAVVFLAIAPQGEGPVERFVRAHGYDLPFYLEIQRTPPVFGARGLPTTWVVDPRGRIVLLRHGEAVWDTPEIEAFLRRIDGTPDGLRRPTLRP